MSPVSDSMNADIKSVLWNVVGGVLVLILGATWTCCRLRLHFYHLQRLLGFRFEPQTEVRITYGQLFLPAQIDADGNPIAHPYRKQPRAAGGAPLHDAYSIEHPVSQCEVRASTYIAALLGLPRTVRQLLVSDAEVDALLESNFISLGGSGSNFKTADILASPANIFLHSMTPEGFILAGQPVPLPYTCDGHVDYGFILRVRPTEFPRHSWIVCAGLGEWGTSGSAWFLARRWEVLIRSIHPFAYYAGFSSIPDFFAIIRVICGQDQSARIERIYRNISGQSRRVV